MLLITVATVLGVLVLLVYTYLTYTIRGKSALEAHLLRYHELYNVQSIMSVLYGGAVKGSAALVILGHLYLILFGLLYRFQTSEIIEVFYLGESLLIVGLPLLLLSTKVDTRQLFGIDSKREQNWIVFGAVSITVIVNLLYLFNADISF